MRDGVYLEDRILTIQHLTGSGLSWVLLTGIFNLNLFLNLNVRDMSGEDPGFLGIPMVISILFLPFFGPTLILFVVLFLFIPTALLLQSFSIKIHILRWLSPFVFLLFTLMYFMIYPDTLFWPQRNGVVRAVLSALFLTAGFTAYWFGIAIVKWSYQCRN
jgi:hypothetical protein